MLFWDDMRGIAEHNARMENEPDEIRLQILLNRAAEQGAKEALRKIGLSDEDAGQDIHDLRTLINDWRSCKRTVFQTMLKATTLAVLSFIAAAVWMKFGGN